MKKLAHPAIEDGYRHHMDFYHPPLMPMPDVPIYPHYGAYLTKRKHDVHTGVDLYTSDGSKVYAVEKGEVVGIRPFTGAHAGCDFWNETWAIDIEGYTGTICYGEITLDQLPKHLKIGSMVEKGQWIANVKRVLKEDKGKATSMLHFALHAHGWKYLYKDQDDPKKEPFYSLQLDPTMLLLQLKNKADIMMLEESVSTSIWKLKDEILQCQLIKG